MAVTEYHRNYRLAQLRANLGLTQAQLAERITEVIRTVGPRWSHVLLPGDYIARLEGGRITWPNATYRAALRTVLGVESDAELGLYCQQVAAVRTEGEIVRRRDFLTSIPAAALSTTPLAELVTVDPSPPPRRVGAEHVAQVRQLARNAGELDMSYGGGLVHDVVAAQVRWAVGLLDAHVDRPAATDLHSAVGDLCLMAAWAAHDSGRDRAAQNYYVAALRCAERADNWELRARTLGDMGRVASYAGLGDDALTHAFHAQLRADRVTPLRRARLALGEAHAHGRLGEPSAALAAITRAEQHFARAGTADEPGWLATFFTSAELTGDTAHVLYDLARRGSEIDRAIIVLRASVDAYSANFPRSRALSTARLAALLMRHGGPQEATTLGNDALDAAERIRSNRLIDTIRHLHQAAAAHRGTADVDALRNRATRLLATA